MAQRIKRVTDLGEGVFVNDPREQQANALRALALQDQALRQQAFADAQRIHQAKLGQKAADARFERQLGFQAEQADLSRALQRELLGERQTFAAGEAQKGRDFQAGESRLGREFQGGLARDQMAQAEALAILRNQLTRRGQDLAQDRFRQQSRFQRERAQSEDFFRTQQAQLAEDAFGLERRKFGFGVDQARTAEEAVRMDRVRSLPLVQRIFKRGRISADDAKELKAIRRGLSRSEKRILDQLIGNVREEGAVEGFARDVGLTDLISIPSLLGRGVREGFSGGREALLDLIFGE